MKGRYGRRRGVRPLLPLGCLIGRREVDIDLRDVVQEVRHQELRGQARDGDDVRVGKAGSADIRQFLVADLAALIGNRFGEQNRRGSLGIGGSSVPVRSHLFG